MEDIWTKVNGTHLQGYIIASRNELTAVFGEPLDLGEGEKVTTEWQIVFPDDVVATIYDWKRYELGAPRHDEINDWHIGGHDHRSVDRVFEKMGDGFRGF